MSPAGMPDEDVKKVEESPSPALDQAAPVWSPEDEAWMEQHIHKDLHHIAKRYGRKIFSMTMMVGQVTGAMVRIVQQRPPQSALVALQVIETHFNQLMPLACKGADIEFQMVMSCKEDIERLAALKSPGTAAKETKSGIILPS